MMRTPLAVHAYRALLALVPGHVRQQVGPSMLASFEEGLREVGSNASRSRLPFVAGELAGLLLLAVRTRLDGRRDRVQRRPRADVLRDVQFAVRTYARNRGVATMAILTLALGLATSIAMFSIVDRVLLRPLPFADPEELVSVYATIPEWRGHPTLHEYWNHASFSPPEFFDWYETQNSFEYAAALTIRTANVLGGDRPRRLTVTAATSDVFRMLGVRPLMGRLFAPGDAEPGTDAVVLSHSLWQGQFGADPAAVGSDITLNDERKTVIGVLPSDFELHGYGAELWVPLANRYSGNVGNHELRVIARLRDNVSLNAAEQQTGALLLAMSAADHIQHTANVVPRHADETADVRAPLLMLLGASLVLLVAACGNVAALLLAHGIRRRLELAVRGALGASRRRLVSQLVTENLTLALIGGAIGLAGAHFLIQALVRLAPADLPNLSAAAIDLRVAGAGLLAAFVCGLVFGTIPALTLSLGDVGPVIQTASNPGSRPRRVLGVLATGQVAVATGLLVGSALFVLTLDSLNRVDTGFRAGGLINVRVAPTFARFLAVEESGGSWGEAADIYYANLTEALESVPGVTAVAITDYPPYGYGRGNNSVSLEGYTPATEEDLISERHRVSSNYHEVLDIDLLAGRYFDPEDDVGGAPPVVIINRELAATAWRDPRDAIGKTLSYWAGQFTIVGVVEGVRDRNLSRNAPLQFYVPRGNRPGAMGTFMIRTDLDPAAVIPAIRERIWATDPELPIPTLQATRDLMAESLAAQRFRAMLVSLFGLLATTFALVGIYGVMSQSVTSRRREIAIRMALGAKRRRIALRIVSRAMAMTALGAGLGLLAVWLASPVVGEFLFGIDSLEPSALVVGTGIIVIATLIGTLQPTVRASRFDPARVLREE